MAEGKKMNPLVMVSLRWGIISGVLSLLSVTTFFYLGKHPFWIFPLFDIRIIFMAIFLFFALKEIRDFHQEGILFFWQGLMASTVFLVIMALISFLGILILGTADPEFVSGYIQAGLEQIKNLSPDAEKQIGAPAIEEMRKILPATTVGWMANRYALQTFVFGAFISIIISIIIRRQPKIL
jgi:hypothetical protein